MLSTKGKVEGFDKKKIEDIIALTPMQEGMLFHYLKNPDSEHYFEQICLGLSGEIDINIFKKAWDFVIGNNEMLRTVFQWEKIEHPIQIYLKEHPVQYDYYDFSAAALSPGEGDKRLKELKVREREKKFNLQEVPFRINLCKLADDKYEMIISNHHIIYDGWSNGIILLEFFNAYNDLSRGRVLVKPEKTKFKEFIRWIRGRDTGKERNFWKSYLNGFDTRAALSIKRKQSNKAGVPGRHRIYFVGSFKNKIQDFAAKSKLTMASFLYTAWGLVLQKYNNSDDVIFGTTVSGRSAKVKGIEEIVGLFINTLPLRVKTQPGEKTKDLLQRIDKESQMREAYEATPLTRIKEYSEIDNNEELFDTIVVIENYPLSARLKTGSSPLTVDSYSMLEMTHYDLAIGVTMGDDIEIAFHYKQKCVETDAVVNLGDHFRNVVQGIIEAAGKRIIDISVISEKEKKKILYGFNNTAGDYPEEKTIYQLFAGQVRSLPDKTALVYRDRQLTYKALNTQASRMARVLIKKGVKRDSLVGIMVDRSLEMLVSIFAILKAGGAYLPIDPKYPAERAAYMIADSNVHLLLGQTCFIDKIEVGSSCEIIDLNKLELSREKEWNLEGTVGKAGDLAYAIYTSGSTGKPKGVLLGHRGIANLSKFHREKFEVREEDRIVQFASSSFDASVWEICMALLNGAALYLLDNEIIGNLHEFENYLSKNGITIITLPPHYANHLNPDNTASLRMLITAGSEPSVEMANRWKEKVSYINAYGPTETSICATVEYVDAQREILDRVSIGGPISNTSIYILDAHMNIQPVGIPGELAVSCVGIAKGYLNRPELTAEKFDHDLWGFQEEEKNKKFLRGVQGGGFYKKSPPGRRRQRIYKTGDLARWLPDGRIEFLGRIDHQVKISGYRIELGEIESQLLKYRGIKEALVTTVKKNKERYLCAYMTADTRINTGNLANDLTRELPMFMIPSYFIQLEEMPLTPSGKIDKKALPEPEITALGGYIAPEGEIEEKLADIYASILEIIGEQLSMNANFFQLGGHSLKAMQLVSKIHKEFEIKVPLDQVFKHPTVKGLADLLKGKANEGFASVNPVEKRDYYALSPAQNRLYALQQIHKNETVYNAPAAVMLEGDLDRCKLEGAFQTLASRHESFRTYFEVVDGQVMQRIKKEIDFKLGANSGVIGQHVMKNFVSPFNLAEAPLMRAGLLKVSNREHLLMLDVHHIVIDGVSMDILMEEFSLLYRGEELEELRLQYKDFSQWHNKQIESGEIKTQEIYWLKVYEGDLPVLNLPVDSRGSADVSFEGGSLTVEIEESLAIKIKNRVKALKTTLNIFLLTAYYILLTKYTGDEDIVVGNVIAGRRHPDLQPIIGFFVNMLAIRNRPAENKTFGGFLGEVRESAVHAYENQDYPFEELVGKLDIPREAGRHPLVETVFTFVENHSPPEAIMEEKIGVLKVKPFEFKNRVSHFDLLLQVAVYGDGMKVMFEYANTLFKPGTIENMLRHYLEILEQVTENENKELTLKEIHISHDFIITNPKTGILTDAPGGFEF